MKHLLSTAGLAVACLLGVSRPASAQPPPSPPFASPTQEPFVWWKNEAFKKELGLTVDQIARIDHIWYVTRPELRQDWMELSRLEEKFSRLLQENIADEAALSRQIDRVETARANANKTRSMMLVRMLMVMTTEQRAQLDDIHARWLREQTSPGRGNPPTESKGPRGRSGRGGRGSDSKP